jgi:hypothetical protein
MSLVSLKLARARVGAWGSTLALADERVSAGSF